MSFAEITPTRNGHGPGELSAPNTLYHVEEERNQYLLLDVAVDITNVTNLFTVPSIQLLCVGFVVVEPCLAALD
jgi:hypothetical protein